MLLDPDLWGLAAGTFFSTGVLAVDFFRGPQHALGIPILIGAGLTFVISYVLVALFVWYLHALREREQHAALEVRRRATDSAHETAEAPEAAPPAGEGT